MFHGREQTYMRQEGRPPTQGLICALQGGLLGRQDEGYHHLEADPHFTKAARSPGEFISQLRGSLRDGTPPISGDPMRFSISTEHSVTIKQILKGVNLETNYFTLHFSLKMKTLKTSSFINLPKDS